MQKGEIKHNWYKHVQYVFVPIYPVLGYIVNYKGQQNNCM